MIDITALAPAQLLGAFSLGLLFGFATSAPSSRGPGAPTSLWLYGPLGAALAALLSGLAAAREAGATDAALLALSIYGVGLAVGALSRNALAPAAPKAMAAIPPVPAAPTLVAAPPAHDAEPQEAFQEAPVAPAAAPVTAAMQEAEPALVVNMAAAPIRAAAKRAGAAPPMLTAPRGGRPDDLSLIKTLGPKSIEKLHVLGVFHYDQIAAWNLDNARWIGAAIGGPGRVERGKWIQQARDILAEKKAS